MAILGLGCFIFFGLVFKLFSASVKVGAWY